jgi:LAS superfamily LD-carboxypeptidase LdcB
MVAAGLLVSTPAWALIAWTLNTEQFTPAEVATLEAVLQTLEPLVTARKPDGTANILTWQALYDLLEPKAQSFLDAFRALRGAQLGATARYFGESEAPDLISVGDEFILKAGIRTRLDPQFLPRPVFEAYQRMMAAMQQDLGRRLYVESGYRSPAYQLYLFLYYMPKHGHSIRETNRFVALPGHSEHGNPGRQAIDFINEAGINGEDHPEEFEALEEYRWLQQHAAAFGFTLSYPRDNAEGTTFEPWHWHYEA